MSDNIYRTKPRHYIVMNASSGAPVACRDTKDEAIAAMVEAVNVDDSDWGGAQHGLGNAMYITTSKERVPL